MAQDSRIIKQAEILVDHSLKFKKGEKCVIFADFEAKPLVLEVYKLLMKRGALDVRFHFTSYEISEIFFKGASSEQLEAFPQLVLDEIKSVDCYIGISSTVNTRGLTGIDAKKMARRWKVTRPITDYRVDNSKWILTRFPTNAQAQEADMSLSDYQDFVFGGVIKVDWKKKFKEQEKLRKRIDKTKEVHIVAPGTNLKINITRRVAVNAAGENNMPDGEVFTSAVEKSTEGIISYSYPAIYMGREYHDIKLEFKKGKVVKATASKGEKDLNKILDMDKGARYIGELGFGNNFQIKKFTKDILFDEKIGGTIHIALGSGYTDTKSLNKSALHWDMIKDLRKAGEIRFDGTVVQKNGKWVY